MLQGIFHFNPYGQLVGHNHEGQNIQEEGVGVQGQRTLYNQANRNTIQLTKIDNKDGVTEWQETVTDTAGKEIYTGNLDSVRIGDEVRFYTPNEPSNPAPPTA